MKSRSTAGWTCVLPFLVLVLRAGGVWAGGQAKPNIVVILADDLGYADLGCQGCDDVPTPHLDSIAAAGVRFTDGYATHPVCSPSRAGLMSGTYQHRFGFEHNSGPERYAASNFGLPRSVPTLAERLKEAGYATSMVGKWHIGFREGLRPHERGFDEFFGFLSGAHSYLPGRPDNHAILRGGEPVEEREYLTDAFGRESAAFIERNRGRPFFLYLAFNAVHSPLQATEAYERRFPDVADRKRKTYAGMLAAMDDAVGGVLEKLREHGLEERTLVFFYSDNGGPTRQTTSRNDPLRGYKGQVFEGGIRVPLLIQWKGTLPAGMVYSHSVMGFDVHATALAAAGVPLSSEAPLDGVDLLPCLLGEKTGPPHESLFWRSGRQHAARLGSWKLVHDPRQGGGDMLFDLGNDVGEANDLAGERPDKLRGLQAAYAAWDAQMMPAQWIRQDARNAEPGGKLRERRAPRGPGRARRGRLQRLLRNADRNGDGELKPEELRAPRIFGRMDEDGDGTVTFEEARRFAAARTRARNADDEAERAPVPDAFRSWFAGLDKNGNRVIEQGEADTRTLRGADRNANGQVSVREAQRYHRDLLAKQAALRNPEIYEPWKRMEGQRPLRTAESEDPLLNLRFTRDLPTGEQDPEGTLITGTECMHLETHRGMLFATLSGWNHDRGRAPWPGPSVAVKRSAVERWEIEVCFGERGGRAGSLRSMSFTTDASGRKLDAPQSVLLCGVGGLLDRGKVLVWARDDRTGRWVKTVAGRHAGPGSPELRVLFDHVDVVTGIHHVFAAASNGMLFRGAYDPSVPGSIAWESEPEWSGRKRRFMAAAQAEGEVFLTVDLEPTQPENGGLFRRVDGPAPKWERLTGWTWSHPNPETPRPWFGMRGLTALSDGTLLGAREHPGAIDRIDPRRPSGKRRTTEYDVRSALLDLWNVPEGTRRGMALIAYNDMLPVIHPETGRPVHLISLGTRHAEGGILRNPNELGASAWYLVRYGEGDYGLGRVFDPAHPLPNRESGGLRATRTIRPSPFPEEAGRVWYFAGFDAFGGPSHLNTA